MADNQNIDSWIRPTQEPRTMIRIGAPILLAVVLASANASATVPLSTDVSAHFSGSGNCAACHTGSGTVMVEDGVDISPATLWRSTMMANAARDPLWQAVVSAEVTEHPELQTVIENTCTTCHAPLGHAQAELDGALPYSMADLAASGLAQDGVSCTLCHQIRPDNLGDPESFTGGYEVGTAHEIFGPYAGPLTGPMVNQTGFTPVAAEHMGDSELCATCHTLFTPFVDHEGNVVGEFPEQAPYLEWQASSYAAQGVECQDCHMPRSAAPVDISTMPGWHTVTHEPYWEHGFVGGNAFMLGLLRDHADELGLSATPAQFDATIERTLVNLTRNSLALDVTADPTADGLDVTVRLTNLTGHKLPTGIPLRRLWLHLRAEDALGATVFESGAWQSDGTIVGRDAPYEPHHDLITDGGQVAIYEAIMGDVDHQQTYTLLHAGQLLKDNRLPPLGMTSAAAGYETIAVAGLALDDPDFNRDQGLEGSGADVVHYRLPAASRVVVEACYQSVVPEFVGYLAGFETPEIDAFQALYGDRDYAPVIMATAELALDATAAPDLPSARIALDHPWPNPCNPGTSLRYTLSADGHARLSVYDLLGHRVAALVDADQTAGEHRIDWQPRDLSSGVYVLRLEALGQVRTGKIMLVE